MKIQKISNIKEVNQLIDYIMCDATSTYELLQKSKSKGVRTYAMQRLDVHEYLLKGIADIWPESEAREIYDMVRGFSP